MGKKVLAIYYSQSGQLDEIINQFTAPMAAEGVHIERVRIRPVTAYPFPWTKRQFYSVMPDAVLGVGVDLQPFTLQQTSYDLIILGYQAWFLSPSIPVNSLLHHRDFLAVLPGTPVVTITGARNMWVNAFSGVKQMLLQAGAKLVGNIALTDTHPNHISFVTLFHWLLSGRKNRYLGFFPLPGVSSRDIAHTEVFGKTVSQHLSTGDWAHLQDELMRQKAVKLKYTLLMLETKAIPTYHVWVNFMLKRKKRNLWLTVFRYYLLFSLFVAAPILVFVDGVFIRPFSAKRIKAKKQHYLALN